MLTRTAQSKRGELQQRKARHLGDAFEHLAEHAIVALARLLVWIVLRPLLWVPLVIMGGGVYWQGPLAAGIAVGALCVALVAWRCAHPRSFSFMLGRHAHRTWRRWRGYGRGWDRKAATCVSAGDATLQLGRVESTAWGERVHVKLPDGLEPDDVRRKAGKLAHTFGAKACRVLELDSGVVLDFSDGQALVESTPAPPISATTNLERLQMGKREDGEPWTIRVLHPERGYQHLFVVGITGAGKSGVFWQAIRELAPGVRDGYVELRVADPKFGVEFGPGEPLFNEYADTDEAIAAMLAKTVRDMKARGERMKAQGLRQHVPTRSEPAIALFVDEFPSLLRDCEDKELAKQMEKDARVILRMGRMLGIFIWAATQDPRIESFNLRPFFSASLGLRLAAANQVDIVFGKGSRDAGVLCDKIKESTPGQGYEVREDGVMLIRSFYVSPQAIADLIRDYAINAEDTAEVKTRVAKLDEIALAAEMREDSAVEDDDIGEETRI